MTEDGRARRGKDAAEDRPVAVAHAAGGDIDNDIVRSRRERINLFHLDRPPYTYEQSSPHAEPPNSRR